MPFGYPLFVEHESFPPHVLGVPTMATPLRAGALNEMKREEPQGSSESQGRWAGSLPPVGERHQAQAVPVSGVARS